MATVDKNGFFLVSITKSMIERAEKKSIEMGILRNSIRNGEGNLAGFLGEEVVLAAFPESISANTYHHDVLFGDYTIEVKTKDRTVPCRLDYEGSVANFNTSQRSDVYVFVSLLRNKTIYTHGYVAGVIDKNEYFKKAIHLKVGDVDPSNGWKVKAECFNLRYSEMIQFR